MRQNETITQPETYPPTPMVSVIVPAFNCSEFLGVALDSIFGQTFEDYEIIVVNDGSPDTVEIERIINSYNDPQKKLIYIHQENQGPAGARNTAILKARGKYLALLDADDVWLPEFLDLQVQALEKNPSLDMICADVELTGDSTLAGKTFFELWPSESPVTFEKLLNMDCAIVTMGVVARRITLIEAGLFDTAFRRSEDYDLWLRLAYQGKQIGYLKKVLGKHRHHASSLAADTSSLIKSQIDVYKKWLSNDDISEPRKLLLTQQIEQCSARLALGNGRRELFNGNYPQARADFAQAYHYYQSVKLRVALLGLVLCPDVFRRLFRAYVWLITRGRTAEM